MTARLYTKYQLLNNLTSTSNQFKEVPILDDWQIKRDWNKVGSLTFKSPEKLTSGTHVKLESPDHRTFGGQIVKVTEQANDFYSYDCLDYKRFLLTNFSLSFNNKRASDILKWISKQSEFSNSPLKWKITNTKLIYSTLAWKDATVLEIISQLMNLEYNKGNLIYFDVDENANLTFKSYPTTIKGYSLSTAFDYSNSIDYSDIATGYAVIDENYNLIKNYNYNNSSLEAVWGNIGLTKTLGDSSSQSKDNNSDDDIKKIVAKINKSLRSYKWARTCTSDTSKCDKLCTGKTMECRGMSCLIFKKLKNNKVPCKIVRYPSKAASSGYHDSVMVKYSTGYKDFDYTGMDSSFGANSAKSKKGTVRIEYKG